MPKQPKRRIFLLDDHPLMLEGLVQVINHESDLEVCGTAASITAAKSKVKSLGPDLVMTDISFPEGPSGLSFMKTLVSWRGNAAILVLSMHDEEIYAERAIKAGAKGYIMKQESPECLLQAIRTVLAGKIYLSPKMSDWLLKKTMQPRLSPKFTAIERLSQRELEVFRLIGQGYGTRQTAHDLRLSISTIETYRAHIKEKLHLADSSELVKYAVQWMHSQSA